jgi:signal transduction histidine kinase
MKEHLKDVNVFVGLSDKSKKERLFVNIDKHLFAKVIKNFLTNSVKHGFPDGADQKMIAFDFSVSEDGLWIELEMMNNGTKFPDGFTFLDFISFGAKSGVNKGAGIGGFLMHEVVKFHDGKFEESIYPEGTVLKITIHSTSHSKEVYTILTKAFVPGVAFKIRLPFNE